jgi:hypothetical protein
MFGAATEGSFDEGSGAIGSVAFVSLTNTAQSEEGCNVLIVSVAQSVVRLLGAQP